MEEKTILYILSDVRSGSTLLENILSKSPEIISVGELHHLDSHINKGKYGKTWDWNCSCGEKFSNCPFWVNVIDNLKKKGINKIANTSIESSKKLLSSKFIETPENKSVIKLINQIFETIFEITKVKAIIDSSKNPEQLLGIYKYSENNVRVIFLKRDIREVAYSKLKWQNKFFGKGNLYKNLIFGKLREKKNVATLKHISEDDKISITYKDLATHPQTTIEAILRKFNLSEFQVPEYMYIENDHTIGGTPNRFEKRKIKYDTSSQEQISKRPLFRFIGRLIDSI